MRLSGNQVLSGSQSRRSYKAVFWYPAGCSTSIIAFPANSDKSEQRISFEEPLLCSNQRSRSCFPRRHRRYLEFIPGMGDGVQSAAMRSTVEPPGVRSALTEKLIADRIQLLHDLLSSPIPHDCVWSGITGHNLTPEKRDNNHTPQPITPTLCLRPKFNL